MGSRPPTDRADPHWFEPLADHLGAAYLRYSFTRGTSGEVDAIVDLAGIRPGARVLDVGCGPGRHALELASRGFAVTGVDISATFVGLARDGAEAAGLAAGPTPPRFVVGDARDLDFHDEFDLVLSLCQGAFGLTGGPAAPDRADPVTVELDEPVLAGMARAAVPGGRIVVSAFSSYFQLRHPIDGETFDAVDGVNHEHTSINDPDGDARPAELWTTCYTPRELRLLARVVGLRVDAVHGVTPGRYRPDRPSTHQPEFLLLATRP